MHKHETDRRAALLGPEPTGLLALLTPDLELAPAGVPWVEGTEEDPAWYLTD